MDGPSNYSDMKVSAKEAEAKLDSHSPDQEPLSPISAPNNSRPASVLTLDPPLATDDAPAPAYGPTVQSPFDFPTADLPPYSPRNISLRPIAIPQASASPTSAFLPAYSPNLLAYGIPPESWQSFITTVSAFLSARVSTQAINHASDVAASLGSGSKRLVSETASIGRSVGKSAKRGDAAGVVRGTIGLTLGSVGRVIGTVVSLPGAAIQAATLKPKTPRQRAEAYILAANKDWFNSRGLMASLLNTRELVDALDINIETFLNTARGQKKRLADEQLRELKPWIDDLELQNNKNEKPFNLERHTLWLVLFPRR